MAGKVVNLNDLAAALEELEQRTGGLSHLPLSERAQVSIAISFRRIADALEKITEEAE